MKTQTPLRHTAVYALGLLTSGVSVILLLSGEIKAAERDCSGIVIRLEAPDRINIAGKKVGDIIGVVNPIVSGTCTKDFYPPDHFLYIGPSSNPVPVVMNSYSYKQSDATDTITVSQSLTYTPYGFLFAADYIHQGGTVSLKPARSPLNIILKEKKRELRRSILTRCSRYFPSMITMVGCTTPN